MRSASRWIYVAVGCVVLLFSGLVYAWSVLSGPCLLYTSDAADD